MAGDEQGIHLHLGVVTHQASRFNVGGRAGRQIEGLAAALTSQGAQVSLLISDRDDYDAKRTPLTRRQLILSAWRQSVLEYRWRRYLSGGAHAIRDLAVLAAMAGRRVLESVWGVVSRRSDSRHGRTAARRLINIDLSHLRVLEDGVAQSADWILVLEDDAWTDDLGDAAAGVLALIDRCGHSPLQFANLSESLPLDVLGVGDLLEHSGTLTLPSGRTADVLAAERPITNTVCAVLYRRDFAAVVAASIRDDGQVPVIPIDWRLNQVILRLWAGGRLSDASCVWVNPGLFTQRSMHPAGAPG